MVSIIIPSYNRASVIRKSIDSILAQTYGNFELLIVDDGSTDETKAVVTSYQDSRIHYIYQENGGACSARNKGIALAKGEYIAFHDSDDVWLPNKLKTQLRIMEKTGADIVVCQMNYSANPGEDSVTPQLDYSGFYRLHDMPHGISTQTIFTKREVVEDIQFDIEMPRLQDMEWLIRAVKKYRLFCIRKVLVNYTFSADAISVSSDKLFRAVSLIEQKHHNLKNEVPLVAEKLSNAMYLEGIRKSGGARSECALYFELGHHLGNSVKGKIIYILYRLRLNKVMLFLYNQKNRHNNR